MNPSLEILSQGDELITGQISGTNAAWLSQRLTALGCNVTRHVTIGDKLEDLTDVLLDIAKRADCCISTGGLGPTVDDLTAEAAAQAFRLPLVFDEIAFGQIAGFFKAGNRPMPECNRKQAMLPHGSIRLENRRGTAPGFAVEFGSCLFFFLPGVPSEMEQMFQEHIKPMLESRYVLKPDRLIIVKTIGIGESDLQERLRAIAIPPQIKLGFRAALGEVETKLLCPGDYPLEKVKNLVDSITGIIGEPVLGVEGLEEQAIDMISLIDKLMAERGYTLAVVEMISRGLLTAKLAQSDFLISSVYERSHAGLAKKLNIDFDAGNLEKTVLSIAIAVLQNTGADIVLLQLAMPGEDANANSEKPLTVLNVLRAGNQLIMVSINISGSPERKLQRAKLNSLDLLRRYLQGKTLPGRLIKL